MLDAFRADNIPNLVFLPDTVMGRLLALAEADAERLLSLIATALQAQRS